ncbi:hypothetical protein DFQ26_007739 [Actinomortierella ambigua]|nr:hypothetical protein DFQ26_007739 [Actinomortierella ambigua]
MKSHRGGIRRLSLLAWTGIFVALILAILASCSLASPIRERAQAKEQEAKVSGLHAGALSIRPRPDGRLTRLNSLSTKAEPLNSNDQGMLPSSSSSPPLRLPPIKSSLMSRVVKNEEENVELSIAGSPEFFDGAIGTETPPSPPAPVPAPDASTTKDVTVKAQGSVEDYFKQYYNYINVPLTWQRSIAGGILLAFGVYFALFGFRFRRFSLLLAGFVGGVIAAYAILVNVEPTPHWSNRVLIYCAVCIAAGLLIGMLMLVLNRWAFWILGGTGGLCLGAYVLSWRNGTTVHSGPGRVGVLVGCSALGILLALCMGQYIIPFASILIGGYMLTVGLDMFLRTGFNENYQSMFVDSQSSNYTLNGGIYGMLGVLSLTFLVGALVQLPLFFVHQRNRRRLARLTAVPPVAGGPNRTYPPGATAATSRDNLLGPNSGAGSEKRKYNWWGKRVDNNASAYHQQQSPYYNNEKVGGSGSAPHVSRVAVPAAAGAYAVGAALPTVVYKEKKNWRGQSKLVSVVDNKPKTIDKVPKAKRAAAADAAYDAHYGGTTQGAVPVSSSAVSNKKASRAWNPFNKTKQQGVSGGGAAMKGSEPRVTFSSVEGGPNATTDGGVSAAGVADHQKGKARDMSGQQQSSTFFNQNAGMQPQMQPNAGPYGGYHNPNGYYPPQHQQYPQQDQMSYILVGVDGQNPTPMTNVQSQPHPTAHAAAVTAPASTVAPASSAMNSTTSAAATTTTTPAPVSAYSPAPTPLATTTTTTQPGLKTEVVPETTTPAAGTKTRDGKSLMGSSMSKLFGRRSAEHPDRNTDGLTASSTAPAGV